MKSKNNIIIFSFAFLLMTGCSEEFLDVESRAIIEAEDRDENFTPEDFVTGVYGMFTEWPYAFSYLGITEIISDNAVKGANPAGTGADKHLLDDLAFSSTVPSVAAMWTHWYKTIGRANYAIGFTEYSSEDANIQDRLIGEAKFLRAYTYFFLVRSFGDVPIQGEITFEAGEPIIDPEADLSVRKSKEEVYSLIEQDLTDAITALPAKSEYADKDLGRATSGAAHALLAKVHLYQEEWAEALQHADAVITSGQYDLEPNYEDIWREYAENGVESIFEIQARGETINHGVQQYSTTQGARGASGWGWGFNVPSEELVQAFDIAGDEIRKDATIIFAGETLWDGREVSASVENPRYNEKAYSSANAGAGDGDKNIRVLRLAEMYLIKAEAALELDDPDTAVKTLNNVRERVNLDPITVISREVIWNERRLELAFEHDRWFDLIRTGQAPHAMAEHGKDFQEKHWLFPIPENQLIQTPAMDQNPGW